MAHPRWIAGLAVAGSVIGLAAAATPSQAASPHTRTTHFAKIDPSLLRGSSFVPDVLSDKKVTVVLQMSGAPVAVRSVQARRSGGRLRAEQRRSIRSDLAAQQNRLHSRLAQLGAHVVGQMQDAYNGIQVLTPQRAVPRAGSAAQRRGDSRGARLAAAERERHSVHRCHRGLVAGRRQRRPADRQGCQGRDHRYRHRLHPCRLRRPRDHRRLQVRAGARHRRPRHRSAAGRAVRPDRAQGHRRLRLRRRRLQRQRPGAQHAAAGQEPARLQQPRHAHRRLARRFRRHQ